MLLIGKLVHKLILNHKCQLKEITGQILSGLHLNQTLLVIQKKYLSQIQLPINQELIHLHTSEIEELPFMLNLNLRVTIGQILSGLLHNQTLLETQKKFWFLILLLTNQELILHLILEIEELHFMLKVMINQKEQTKELIN